jgi:hypothetical protein
MAGRDRDQRRVVAVRERDARVRGHGERRADARHHLEGDAARTSASRLLAAAPEQERVAVLEAHDDLPGTRTLDEQRLDVRLTEARRRASGRRR